MQSPRTLVWLASYPKSGNTWLRAFLANYFIAGPGPVPINAMQRISSGDSSAPSYAELGRCDPARLTPAQVVALRQRHLERIAGNAPVNFIKTHCINRKIGPNPLVPGRLTRAAIYIIRDPRDMVLSYADHFGLDAARAVAAIASAQNRVPGNQKTVMQWLGNWSDHVRTWTRARDFPVLTLRYEDMLDDPAAAFLKVLKLIDAPVDQDALDQAVEHSSFGALSAQEAATGFRERGPKQERFFRKGTSGQWREQLKPELAERIAADHGAAMQRHGYLA